MPTNHGFDEFFGNLYHLNAEVFVPIQQKIKQFLATIPDYPFQMGSSLSAAGINYDLFRRAGAMKRLEGLQKQLGDLGPGAR